MFDFEANKAIALRLVEVFNGHRLDLLEDVLCGPVGRPRGATRLELINATAFSHLQNSSHLERSRVNRRSCAPFRSYLRLTTKSPKQSRAILADCSKKDHCPNSHSFAELVKAMTIADPKLVAASRQKRTVARDIRGRILIR
jgi:hypothetical protein